MRSALDDAASSRRDRLHQRARHGTPTPFNDEAETLAGEARLR